MTICINQSSIEHKMGSLVSRANSIPTSSNIIIPAATPPHPSHANNDPLDSSSSRSASTDNDNESNIHVTEKKRYGTVKVTVSSQLNKRANEVTEHVVTPCGAVIYGASCNIEYFYKSLAKVGFKYFSPQSICIRDTHCDNIVVIHANRNWHIIPSPEAFSRHSGTCIVLGDRNINSAQFSIKLGDCIRLGSVGLVVSEVKTHDGVEKRLDSSMLQFLKDESIAIDLIEEMAAMAADELDDDEYECAGKSKGDAADFDKGTGGMANGERCICYMCYETHDTRDDRLVAPCDCKGDTRYVHVQCLQKWYYSTLSGSQTQVIRTTANGAPACKICGAAYKTTFVNDDGNKSNLLEVDSKGPYISLVVVTKHDANESLFNTKFRLNFGRPDDNPDLRELIGFNQSILVGRSSSCNMVLDYRTVSTVHAKLSYENGAFFIQDNKSSNGTMLHLKSPFVLNYGQEIKLRSGRSTIAFKAKRSFFHSMIDRLDIRANASCMVDSSTSSTFGSITSQQLIDDLQSIMVRMKHKKAALSLTCNSDKDNTAALRKLSPPASPSISLQSLAINQNNLRNYNSNSSNLNNTGVISDVSIVVGDIVTNDIADAIG